MLTSGGIMANDAFSEVALHIRGFQVSRMLHVAAVLRLADHVGDGLRTVSGIAAASGANADMLRRLFRRWRLSDFLRWMTKAR
jgi:hypothetical protein